MRRCAPRCRPITTRSARSSQRRGIEIERITRAVLDFHVAIPSWGVGTGGTRFARFPGTGEPRNVFEKLEDCAVIHALTGATPTVSLHLPWDRAEDYGALKELARSELGLSVRCGQFQHFPGPARAGPFLQVRKPDAHERRSARAGRSSTTSSASASVSNWAPRR